jgi:hypothetical protein
MLVSVNGYCIRFLRTKPARRQVEMSVILALEDKTSKEINGNVRNTGS